MVVLVCCSAFCVRRDAFANLTLKKVPKAVLKRCEWGHDDYSLSVENLPKMPREPEQRELLLIRRVRKVFSIRRLHSIERE